MLGALEEPEGALASYTRRQAGRASVRCRPLRGGRRADHTRALYGGCELFPSVLDAEREMRSAAISWPRPERPRPPLSWGSTRRWQVAGVAA